MEVDFFASVELTRTCLPLLTIWNSSDDTQFGFSVIAVAVPLKSEYCAAKFALRGWRVHPHRTGLARYPCIDVEPEYYEKRIFQFIDRHFAQC